MAEGSWEYKENPHKKRNRLLGLAGLGLGAIVLTQTPMVKNTLEGLNPSDPYKPRPTDTLIGITTIKTSITTSDGSTLTIRIRENPAIHGKDEFASNIIPLDQIKTLNKTNIEGAAELTIENVLLTQGENVDDSSSLTPGKWFTLDVGRIDGTHEPGYLSLSNKTSELIILDDNGISVPLTRKDNGQYSATANGVRYDHDDLNKVKITKPE